VVSDKVSNAVRLPNGNTLVNFGFCVGPEEPVLVFEARPDGPAVWEQALTFKGIRAVRYRVYPWTSLTGELPVAPTLANLP
jgi:hypothetical protein